MIVVMFGMLEIAVKSKNETKGDLQSKGIAIKNFLTDNLSEKIKTDIAHRYKIDKTFGYKSEIKKFGDVIDHLWYQIRCGFIHDASLESKGMEWTTFGKGKGTEDDPITIESDTPMQELLQITWQAILHSFGYMGSLELPKHKG